MPPKPEAINATLTTTEADKKEKEIIAPKQPVYGFNVIDAADLFVRMYNPEYYLEWKASKLLIQQ